MALSGATATTGAAAPAYAPGELLVRFRTTGKSAVVPAAQKVQAQKSTLAAQGAVVEKAYAAENLDGVYLVKVPENTDLLAAKAALDADPDVESTSLNYRRYLLDIPSDPYYGQLWGLNNTGQDGGTPGADISASGAWKTTKGNRSVIVAVLDTGADYDHPDLAANLWTNPGEIPDNGIDDDGNGYIDDYHGWDFGQNDNDPMDWYGHGTHCAGTIGAVGNNGIGVTGVNWNVSIMPLKIMAVDGGIYDAGIIDAINYAGMMHADILSCSWGSYGYNPVLKAAFDASPTLTVASAGNSNVDCDVNPMYPASFDSPNILSVAASDRDDGKAWFSNYGKTTIDVAAPGVSIMSTLPDTYDIGAPIVYENFTTRSNWNDTGQKNWTLNTTTYVSAPSSITTGPYENAKDQFIDYDDPIPLAGMTHPWLQYSMKGETDKDNDFFVIYVSTDRKNWVYLGNRLSGNFGDWKLYNNSLADYKGKTIYLRLGLETDSSITGDGVWIDDLKVGDGTNPSPQYASWNGTSMAAPHVSGLAALLKGNEPSLSPVQIRSRILDNADTVAAWSGKTVTGGRINADRTLNAPYADFSANVTKGNAPLSVQFTDTSGGPVTAWNWSFGDDGDWKQMTADAGWSEREGQTMVALQGGSLILTGGTAKGTSNNETWRSDDNGATWTLVNGSSGWLARYGHTAVALPDSTIVLMGGYARNSPLSSVGRMNDTWVSADQGATWSLANADSGWVKRQHPESAALSDGTIVLFGGSSDSSTMLNDTWRSADHGRTWTLVNANADWPARYWFGSTVLSDDSIVLMGGDTGSFVNDVWITADQGATWTKQTSSASWSPRRGISAVTTTGDSIVVIGGNYVDGYYKYSNETWISADRGVTWSQTGADAGWKARHDLAAAALPDGSIVMTGGYRFNSDSGEDMRFSDAWWFLPASRSVARNPVHTYPAPGTYTVSLNAIGPNGSDILNRTGYILVTLGSQWVPRGGSVSIGESGLDISDGVGTNASIAWWASSAGVGSALPDRILDVSATSHNLFIDPNEFVGYTGSWYSYDASGSGIPPLAIVVIDPLVDLAIPDTSTSGNDVSDRTLPKGDELAFRITTNLAGIASQRGISGVPYRIWLTDPTGATLTTVTGSTAKATVLSSIPVNTSAYSTGSVWDTANTLYPAGNYTARAEVNFNGIKDNYQNGGADYTGKTVSVTRFVLLSTTAATDSPVPVVSSINPSSVMKNSSFLFAITGKNFVGATTVEFRNSSTGLINTTLTSVTATRIEGNATIPAGTVPGAWNIRVITDGSETIRTGLFSVTAPANPVVSGITPTGTWYMNATVNYTITGTGFEPGKTGVQFRNKTGAALNTTPENTGVWLVTPTAIYGTIVVPYNVTGTSSYNITVTTDDGTRPGVKDSAFSVAQMGVPGITAVTPSTGTANSTITFTLSGSNFEMESGYTNVSFVNSFSGTTYYATVTSATVTKIAGTLAIPATATSGSYDATVRTSDGGTTTMEGAFTITTPGLPVITLINQTYGYRNTTVPFRIQGSNFQAAGATTVLFISPISGARLNGSILSATPVQIDGTFTIPSGATSGSYDLVVMTADGGYSTKAGAFRIGVLPQPAITMINVTSGNRNATYAFVITGTNFQPDGTYARLYLNSSVAPVYAVLTSITGTKAAGTFTIPAAQTIGKYRLDLVTVSGGSTIKPGAFTVSAVPPPTITTITPGETFDNSTVTITVTGKDFQPGSGTTATLFHPSGPQSLNVTLISVTPTRFNGTVTIPLHAPTTALWTLNVTTIDGGKTTKTPAITVKSITAPKYGTITPATGYPNGTISYTLTGSSFQPGLTSVAFGYPGYGELNSTIYNIAPSQIIGGVSFPPNAPTGPWWINITTVNGGNLTKPEVLKVDKVLQPIVSTFSPASAYRSTTVSWSVSGKYFQPGGRTSVNLSHPGYPEIPTTLTAVYTTKIFGTVTVPAGSAPGTWNVNVTTIDGKTGTGKNVVTLV